MNRNNLLAVVVADDQTSYRQAIAKYVSDFPIVNTVYEASNGKEVLDIISRFPVDVILLDLHMPVMNGYETCNHLKSIQSKAKVILLSMFVDGKNRNILIEKYGADDCHSKDVCLKELEASVNKVAKEILQAKSQTNKASYPFNLSDREIEVLVLVMEGLTSKEIAEKLFINKRTVDSRRDCLYKKIGAKNSSEAIFIANKLFNNKDFIL